MQNSLTQALTTPSSNMTKNRKLILCAQLKLPAGRGVGIHTYSLSWQPKHWEGATEHGMWQRYGHSKILLIANAIATGLTANAIATGLTATAIPTGYSSLLGRGEGALLTH